MNPNDMAYPLATTQHTPNNSEQMGFTKREAIAIQLMSGLDELIKRLSHAP